MPGPIRGPARTDTPVAIRGSSGAGVDGDRHLHRSRSRVRLLVVEGALTDGYQGQGTSFRHGQPRVVRDQLVGALIDRLLHDPGVHPGSSPQRPVDTSSNGVAKLR
jgi:hypothetical protein